MREFFKGIGFYFKAHKVISQNRLYAYVIIPGIISLCYIAFLIFIGEYYFLHNYIQGNWLPDFFKRREIVAVTAVFLWFFLLIIGYMTYKHVVMIIFSPYFSQLSQVTENAAYKCEYPSDFSFKQLIADITRGLVLNLRNLMLTLIYTFFAWLTVFIPVIGIVISPVLMILIQSYFDGFNFIDYTLERKKYSVKESIYFAGENKTLIMGIGTGFIILMLIPVIGWFIAPAYGTVSSTLAVLEKINKNE